MSLSILAITHNRAMVEAADRVYQLSGGHARLVESDRGVAVVK